ncbi:MAG TPA: 4a-hydroxytetrahydrobiopterin dehydratase [Acidimicrobiales bacterium]|nr:4a-hydroxytetrahydrobiopterin dehydratase [Acidimicrobiales bacterium]
MTRPPRLDAGTIDQALASARSPWERTGDTLVLERRFSSFPDAIAFVNAVADQAEARNHHPDISIRYTEVRLELSTHDAGGLTQLDLDLAAAVAQL